MKEAMNAILQGMDEPRVAVKEIAFVVVLLSMIIGFCSWYAVPIPQSTIQITEKPMIQEATRMALK